VTAEELARKRMLELTREIRPHARGCDAEHEVDGCPGCVPSEALSELRRLGALYPRERGFVAWLVGRAKARTIWPGLRAKGRAA